MAEVRLSESLLKTDSCEIWKGIGFNKRSGMLIPLFSVHSKSSVGIGDFRDLRLLVDWMYSTGNSIIQLLPLNEVGPLYCPYDALSSFALEPAYICLEEIAAAKNMALEEKINSLRERFSPPRTHIDYSIKQEKMKLLWEIFIAWDHQDSLDFKRFQKEHAYWLFDFALYKTLKDYQGGSPWYMWENKFKDRNAQALENFSIEHAKEINFQMWVQWELYKQLSAALAYAKTRNVLLKGDLPILVSLDSADVWQCPQFFKLELAAGAPPDMYCARGQRWGMPTYNWEMIEADEFRYSREKLQYAQNFYDLLRIDHVVGLFRIWSIPYDEPLENKGLNGFFDPQDESKWEGQGKNILRAMIKATDMLLCAEDLGVIPKVCTDTLRELGMPGNDVQRWVKDWALKHDFLSPQDFRPLSVAMLSTHDTTNWPAWWENEAGTVDEDLFIRKCRDHRAINYDWVKEKLFDLSRSAHARLRWKDEIYSSEKLAEVLGKRKEEVRDFIELYENSFQEKEKLWKRLELSGEMREESDTEIVRQALRISLESRSVFCVNTIIDWLYLAGIFKQDPYQYRINTPGTISNRNWSLVLPLSLEELLSHKINKEIRNMVASSGRIV